jgi:hypothetical protein
LALRVSIIGGILQALRPIETTSTGFETGLAFVLF